MHAIDTEKNEIILIDLPVIKAKYMLFYKTAKSLELQHDWVIQYKIDKNSILRGTTIESNSELCHCYDIHW